MVDKNIKKKFLQYQNEGKSLFVTSSFQTQSLPLLHIISTIDNTIPVYFIDTGYHFPETVRFRDKIVDLLDLTLVKVHSFVSKHLQKDNENKLYFTSDPDYCCFLNKVQPLQPILSKMDIWINGIRGEQNDNRKKMHVEEKTEEGAIRYHPMLNWTNKMIYDYINHYKLPKHPLDDKGYMSISCEPCTRKFSPSENMRDARWFGLNKTECGLHTELIKKS